MLIFNLDLGVDQLRLTGTYLAGDYEELLRVALSQMLLWKVNSSMRRGLLLNYSKIHIRGDMPISPSSTFL